MNDPRLSPAMRVEYCNHILGNIQFLRFAKVMTRAGESGETIILIFAVGAINIMDWMKIATNRLRE